MCESNTQLERILYKLKNLIKEHEYKLKVAKQYSVQENIVKETAILDLLNYIKEE
jgi:hypothetical protein